jgi:hypothetical protein
MRMILFLKKLFIFSLILSCNIQVFSQYENVTIIRDKVSGTGPCEPTIFISPKSPNIMVASMINDKTMQTSATKTGHNKVYFSKDFGKSWAARNVKSKFGDFGDPCIIADNEGYFYYFHMSDPKKMGWDGEMVMDRIVCQRSTNGKTWNSGVSIGHNPPKKHEKPWGTFDETSGRVIVAWTQYDHFDSANPQDSANIMLSISDDRGLSWTPPTRINQYGGNCSGELQTPIGPIPTAGPEQDVYVTWAYNEKIYFDKSIDGGVSWMKEDKVVADQPGGWHFNVPGFGKASGSPVNGCDISYGPFHGNIYVSWADQRNGVENTDIWISKSVDRGNTWSAPQRVNDDEVVMMGRHQCYNWMAVDPITGYIYIIFYDRRNHTDIKTDVYMAVSSDGGETFINEKISAEPFEPNSDVYMGDYINITAYGGFVRPIWTVLKNGELSIQTAIIDPR